MQILTQPQTEHHLPFTALLPALEQMFTTGCEVPLRHHHAIPGRSTDEDGILLLMPAWQTGQRLGVKTVSIFPGNARQGLPGLHSVYILYDARTGQPLAVLDGDTITSRRTAAASALAARWLSRPDARRLLVVGSGRVARLLPAAYRCVRALDTVEVWSRSPASAQALVDDLLAQGLPAQHAPDLEAAVRRATVFTDTTEALLKAGDLLGAIAEGAWSTNQLAATLEQLCRQQHPGRRSTDEITLFKSVGSALEDLAAACLAYDGFCAG